MPRLDSPRKTYLNLLIFVLINVIGAGCASRVYKASHLPVELMAPASVDLEAIDLSGLANHSVSLDVIQPGDVLDVSMVADFTKLTTTTTPVRVADDGTVVIPLVGKVAVAGMEVKAADQTVNAQSILRGIYRNPCITITMKRCRTCTVTVVGAVKTPGTHELPRGSSSLMAALVAAEGLSKDAGTTVEIRHTDMRPMDSNLTAQAQAPDGAQPPVALASYASPSSSPTLPIVTSTTVDLQSASSGAIKIPELRDGDVVQVMKRTLKPVYVMGLVRKPGEFPYPPSQEIRVLDALALAGGVSNSVAEEVLVIRQRPGEAEPARIAVSIQSAKNGRDNVVLAPGDTVTVEQTPATVAIDLVQTIVRFSFGSNVSLF